jgi:hypothetical protein
MLAQAPYIGYNAVMNYSPQSINMITGLRALCGDERTVRSVDGMNLLVVALYRGQIKVHDVDDSHREIGTILNPRAIESFEDLDVELSDIIMRYRLT